MFLRASELNQHSKRITTGKGVTSSVSCAMKYFEEDEGTGSKQLSFFWLNAARYGRLGIMEWACQQAYSAVWGVSYIGPCICHSAGRYGQLQALQWLRENGCNWEVILVLLLLLMAISPACNGRERTDVTETVVFVILLLVMAISQSSNGRERTAVTGTRRLVQLLLNTDISPS